MPHSRRKSPSRGGDARPLSKGWPSEWPLQDCMQEPCPALAYTVHGSALLIASHVQEGPSLKVMHSLFFVFFFFPAK